MALWIGEGVAALPSGWGALRVMSRPEAESASVVVGSASSTGLKVVRSQWAIGG